jgi:SAM-dependent methyltransferase
MKFPCGCINETDPESGVTKSISKCPWHKARMGRGGLAYYEELGCLKDGKAIPTNHIKEFKTALELMGADHLKAIGVSGKCLEIGCGVGVYIPWIEERGYKYEAVESDQEAAKFVSNRYGVWVWNDCFENLLQSGKQVDLILAAHVIEHLKDSPGAIASMFGLLKPGGRALLLIPEGTDQTNPDHLWFYTPETFLALLQRAGFVDIRMVVQNITGKENFIYASAYKPKPGNGLRKGLIYKTHSEVNKALAQLTLPNHQAYADRHGYDLISINCEYLATWDSVPYLKDLLSRYEWVFAIGSDVIFTNPDLSVESRMAGRPEAVFIAEEGLHPEGGLVNNDTTIIRNTLAGHAYLGALYEARTEYRKHKWQAQQATLDMIGEHPIAVLPAGVLQSFPIQGVRGGWKPGDFAIHFLAGTNEDKLRWATMLIEHSIVLYRPLLGGSEFEVPVKVKGLELC